MQQETKQQIEQAATDLNLTLLWQEQIQPGDLYLAARNSGPKLLEAEKILHGCVVATTIGDYSFYVEECVKVKAAD